MAAALEQKEPVTDKKALEANKLKTKRKKHKKGKHAAKKDATNDLSAAQADQKNSTEAMLRSAVKSIYRPLPGKMSAAQLDEKL